MKHWHKARDLKATDGYRYVRLEDAAGKTLYCIEVMEIHRGKEEQAAVVASIVRLLNRSPTP